MDPIAVGIAGAGGRGEPHGRQLQHAAMPATVRAVCDVDTDGLERVQRTLDAPEAYTDYETMLAEARLDAVVVATPMPFHAPQAIAALERDIHVFSEVPAAVSLDDARELVAAYQDSSATYMLAENYNYRVPNVLVRELVAAGRFGDPYYAEGEYLHELRAASWVRDEPDRWRREYQTGRNGITYPTHPLGPVLSWLPEDRVARLCCAGSGHHYTDPDGQPYEQEDTTVLLAETECDRLLKIRMDMLSERPHAMDNYQLQGTKGSYESARAPSESNRVWLDDLETGAESGEYEWRDLSELTDVLPERYRDPPPAACEAGHGGGDYYVVADFVESVRTGTEPPIDIHTGLDMTLPGLISQQSIADDGAWMAVPDSREW